MSIFNSNNVGRVSGTITGVNQEVTLESPGAAGAIIVINGTWAGQLRSVGTNSGVEGRRLLFVSGKGSKGTNKINNSGTLIQQEYRIIAGGDNYSIKSNETFTGSVTVTIISSTSTNTVFGIGPFHTASEEAIRDSRAFLSATGSQFVPANNILACKLENPVNSGINIVVQNRIFGNDVAEGGENLEYIAYSNPTITTLSNIVNGFNLRAGESPSTATFSWETDSQANITMGGTQGSGEILPRGQIYNRKLDFFIPPGFSLGFTVKGAGNNLTNAARVSIILEWYEEIIN